jgi:membrane protein implicated in regulation of membrane protease activity
MFEFTEHAWAVWIIAAVVAALLEISVPSFSFSFASLGAMVAALSSLAFGWQVQALVFCLTSIISMFLLRTRLMKKMHVADKIPSRTQALIGLKGEVTEAINPALHSGRITVAGQDWAARGKMHFAVGQSVTVIGSDGIVLIVKEI